MRPQLLGLMESLELRGSRACRRAPNSFGKARFGLGPKVAGDRTSGNKGERPPDRQEEGRSPPIDLSIVQEAEKQQAEAGGKEGKEAKENGSEAKEAGEMKLTKETKVMDPIR